MPLTDIYSAISSSLQRCVQSGLLPYAIMLGPREMMLMDQKEVEGVMIFEMMRDGVGVWGVREF